MPNLDIPQWVMDLFSEDGELLRLSQDEYLKLDAFYQAGFNHPRTLREMADVELSKRYNSVKRRLKTLLRYNQAIHAAPSPETHGNAKPSLKVPAGP